MADPFALAQDLCEERALGGALGCDCDAGRGGGYRPPWHVRFAMQRTAVPLETKGAIGRRGTPAAREAPCVGNTSRSLVVIPLGAPASFVASGRLPGSIPGERTFTTMGMKRSGRNEEVPEEPRRSPRDLNWEGFSVPRPDSGGSLQSSGPQRVATGEVRVGRHAGQGPIQTEEWGSTEPELAGEHGLWAGTSGSIVWSGTGGRTGWHGLWARDN